MGVLDIGRSSFGIARTTHSHLTLLSTPRRRIPWGDGFYEVPDGLEKFAPGELIRYEPMHAYLVPGVRLRARAWRILYRSTGAVGEPTAVSGTLLLPENSRRHGTLPLIAYAIGTHGIGDDAAPSRLLSTGLRLGGRADGARARPRLRSRRHRLPGTRHSGRSRLHGRPCARCQPARRDARGATAGARGAAAGRSGGDHGLLGGRHRGRLGRAAAAGVRARADARGCRRRRRRRRRRARRPDARRQLLLVLPGIRRDRLRRGLSRARAGALPGGQGARDDRRPEAHQHPAGRRPRVRGSPASAS